MFSDSLLERARRLRRHVALSEGQDPRVREAARRLVSEGIARVTLLGDRATERWALMEAPGVAVRVPDSDPLLGEIADLLAEKKPERVSSVEAARQLAAHPLRFAAGLVALGEADATVGGAAHTTGEVLRAALWLVGPSEGIATVSSSFYMVTEEYGVLTFADCGVVQYPDAAQLADIALAAAKDRPRIVGDEPVVAFLSHSTHGSATGESVERVREAVARFRSVAPQWIADGELQGDAALVPEVARHKAPDSPVAGRANVLVFPDLDSGNIAYKLVQRIARARAVGPIVQGLARPCCDLSRGADAADIVLVAAIAALQAETPNAADTAEAS